MAKQKIVSIEIELKDYEPIKFTMDEAKELYEQLHGLFGEKVVREHHFHDWYRRPYYYWSTTGNNFVQCSTTDGEQFDNLAGKSISSAATQMKVSYLANSKTV